jgi:hypothetical protein
MAASNRIFSSLDESDKTTGRFERFVFFFFTPKQN